MKEFTQFAFLSLYQLAPRRVLRKQEILESGVVSTERWAGAPVGYLELRVWVWVGRGGLGEGKRIMTPREVVRGRPFIKMGRADAQGMRVGKTGTWTVA